MAIIAALSVQYSNAGIKVFHPSSVPIFSKELRKSLLALTPPTIQMFVIPVSCAAFLIYLIRLKQSIIEQMHRYPAMFFYKIFIFIFHLSQNKIASRFNPLKAKFNPSIFGSVNLYSAFPCCAYLSIKGHQDRESQYFADQVAA